MNNPNPAIQRIRDGRDDLVYAKQTRQVLNLGQRNGWDFQVMGVAELPQRPVHLENWVIIPAQEDHTPVPPRTLQRIQSIYAAGLRPQGFVVVHEAPRQLTAPGRQTPVRNNGSAPQPRNEVRGRESSSLVLGGIAAVIGTLLEILVTIVFPALMLGLVALDPIVIAVMEDNTWVEIDRWKEEIHVR